MTVSGRIKEPHDTAGSRAPHTPAEITRGCSSPSSNAGNRAERTLAARPTGARRKRASPKAGKEKDLRRGSRSARASARASSSTAARTRIAPKRAGPGGRRLERLFLLLALDRSEERRVGKECSCGWRACPVNDK